MKLNQKPTAGTAFIGIDRYWDNIPKYPQPHWAHDFISVHDCRDFGSGYRLIAPIKACTDNGTRPEWENLKFCTLFEAARYAIDLSKVIDAHVVII